MRWLHEPVYATRLAELVRQIAPHVNSGDRVLDVGCGSGALGEAIMRAHGGPANVMVRGLERAKRGGESIHVDTYPGGSMPYDDNAFDVVILACVLHHDKDPDALIAECVRVCRRLLIVMDHQRAGILAQARISLIDWAANFPHGVPCYYRYLNAEQWASFFARHGLSLKREMLSINLYPPGYNLLFGRKLQYLAVLRVPGTKRG